MHHSRKQRILKRLLQQERAINRTHKFEDLPIRQHKIILPRVSDVYNAEYIKSSLLEAFEFPPDELEITHSFLNKRGGKN